MGEPRKHILIVIVGISAGTGTVCLSLGRGLRRYFGDRFKVSLLTFRTDALRPEVAANFDSTFALQTQVSKGWREILELRQSLSQLSEKINEIQPDLVLSIGTFSNLACGLSIKKIPVVLSDHLNLSERLRARAMGFLSKPLLRSIYRKHAAVGVSHDVSRDLQEHFDAQRAVTILNGVDVEEIVRAAGGPEEVPAKYLVSVGRLDVQKDPQTLLRAFWIARLKGLAHDLVFVGDGPLKIELESLTNELGIVKHIRFAGQLTNPFPTMRDSAALVLSSIYEGFGLVLLEAMALGVPCISTDCPSGPREILGDGEFGILVPMKDPEKLAEAMVRLTQNEVLHQHFVEKSTLRARQLNLENMCRQYADLFESELNSFKPRR